MKELERIKQEELARDIKEINDTFDKLDNVYAELEKILQEYNINPHTAGYELAGLIMDAYHQGINDYIDENEPEELEVGDT